MLNHSKAKILIMIFILFIHAYIVFPQTIRPQDIEIHKDIPTDVLNRIFLIQYTPDSFGTCFVIDVDLRQYIITAKHVVKGIKPKEIVKIRINGKWYEFKVTPIFSKQKDYDVVALAADQVITSKMKIVTGISQLRIGQDVYFLGFPLGFSTITGIKELPEVALVKKGILSGSA